MNECPELLDDNAGEVRKLGLLLPPIGFVTAFPSYEAAGKPMYSRDDLLTYASVHDTKGRTRFDSSWIQNQRNKSSCNGFAASAALGKSRKRRGLEKVILSGAYIYSLINGNRDQGSMLDDGMKAMMEHGIAPESMVPWDKIYQRDYAPEAHREAARYKALECYSIKSELELFSALAAGFDCVVAVDANNAFMKLDSNGVAGGGSGPGNHAVSVDGYSVINGKLAADGVNSWGLSYGEQGRAWWLFDRHFSNTIGFHSFYAVRSAIDDPQGDNPPGIK